jgi:ribosomal protein L15E
MLQFIKQLIFDWRFQRAISKADKLKRITKRKHMVLLMNRKLVVASKTNLRRMIRERRFVKGTKITDIENKALYITS